ncbi:efflux RND transporter periplasmic adaptor subunit [Bradyrhizobium prioriisuperbiae]|uniref:efflux RND transporter periplasmic adaptor subunit n=1 Tax=Bradyrhizobium prioriisuperbiae TaxID=2854389 RepID=UPI0028F0D0DD|nr:efflux RND transporter periplasmic adaptor subunit [Bradyrhizobium prioritasuperba]
MTEDKTKLLRSLAIDRSSPNPAPPSSANRWKLPIVVAAVIVVAALAAVFAFRIGSPNRAEQVAVQSPPPAPRQDAQPQAVAPKEPGTLAASGYVVARRRATIAAEITGKVVEVLVEEGMTVAAGQVTARLDSVLAEKDLALAQSRAEAAQAAVAAVSADLDDAHRILSRIRSLSQNKFATEADLTKSEARVAVLTAQMRQAQSQWETAKLDAQRTASVLDKHQIRAPFAGVVVDRSAQPGEMISPMSVGGFTRTGICTVVDMDSIEIEVDVNEAFIGRVVAGGPVTAVLDAYPDWQIPASVIAIVPTANREKATVKVRIRLLQKDPRILPDMAVKVTFLRDAKPQDGQKDSAKADPSRSAVRTD